MASLLVKLGNPPMRARARSLRFPRLRRAIAYARRAADDHHVHSSSKAVDCPAKMSNAPLIASFASPALYRVGVHTRVHPQQSVTGAHLLTPKRDAYAVCLLRRPVLSRRL